MLRLQSQFRSKAADVSVALVRIVKESEKYLGTFRITELKNPERSKPSLWIFFSLESSLNSAVC